MVIKSNFRNRFIIIGNDNIDYMILPDFYEDCEGIHFDLVTEVEMINCDDIIKAYVDGSGTYIVIVVSCPFKSGTRFKNGINKYRIECENREEGEYMLLTIAMRETPHNHYRIYPNVKRFGE